MVNLEYHKGSFCVYTPIFCQEGYCSECEINYKKSSMPSLVNQPDRVILQQAANRNSHFTGVFVKV
jgi:hypothetical protein